MKKRFTAVVMGLLLLMLLIPSTAFADGIPAVVGNLDLTSGDHADKTLAKDGYEWDSATNTLTIQDLAVTGDIILPKLDCTINVKGECSAAQIKREDGDQALTVIGESKATLKCEFTLMGDLSLDSLTMTDGAVSNGNGGNLRVLTLKNSDITLHHLSWMTASGIKLENSSLTVNSRNDVISQFWTEKITMDEKSIIESFNPMQNYAKEDLSTFDSLQEYIAEPEGGRFANARLFEGAADVPLTVVDKDGNAARHFILKAPGQSAEKCQIDLKASPAEGGTVSGAGEYDCDTRATVKAVANKGYHFVRWEDWQGNTVSKDAAYSFTVKETTTLTAVFAKDGATPAQPGGTDQNTDKGTAPKTGDNAHPMIWIALLAVSVLGIAVVAVFGRKHASQKK